MSNPSTDTWHDIEAAFREWSFHVYWEKSFASVIDMTLRFAYALVASSKPLLDRAAVLAWHASDKRRKRQCGSIDGPLIEDVEAEEHKWVSKIELKDSKAANGSLLVRDGI